MMDWLHDFEVKFKDYQELQVLKKEKYHGSLMINFSDGVPQNYNFTIHRRAVTINGMNSPTETKGG